MKRRSFAIAVPIVVLLAAGSALGQNIDDQVNCNALSAPGLYYLAYTETGEAALTRVGAKPLRYQPISRFYFVSSSNEEMAARREEGVWHIRTQTKANAAPTADTVYVYRPGVRNAVLANHSFARVPTRRSFCFSQ